MNHIPPMLDPNKGPNMIAAVGLESYQTYEPTDHVRPKDPKGKVSRHLARVCWKLIRKLGACETHFECVKTYSYTTSIQERVRDKVMFAASEVLERGDDIDDYAVVMGEVQLRDLWSDIEAGAGGITLNGGDFRFYHSNGYRTQIIGLPVHVVRGLFGVALIPKVIIEKKAR